MKIYPVIIPVKQNEPDQASLSFLARHGLLHSVKCSGIKGNYNIDDFKKSDTGVPVKNKGLYWSVSHKPRYVCSVVSTSLVGIDVELLKESKYDILNRICTQREQGLLEGYNHGVIRVFSAKEALLKSHGLGVFDMHAYELVRVSEAALVFKNEREEYCVQQHFLDDHVFSITGDSKDVSWELIKTTL